MPSPYYVDPDASGDNNGSTWTHAWQTLQQAANGANTAGDIVYCRNSVTSSESLSAAVDFDTNTGTLGNPIRFIGCNPSGVVDGTRYKLDCSTNQINAIHFSAGASYIILENIECASSATAGLKSGIDYTSYVSAYCDNCRFINVYVHGFDGSGVDIPYMRNSHFIGCTFSDNDVDGVNFVGINTIFYGCVASGNTLCGFETGSGAQFANCLAYENGDDGFEAISHASLLIINCVSADNGGAGFDVDFSEGMIVECRATNNAGGGVINASTLGFTIFGSYVAGNTGTQISTQVFQAPYRGSSTWVHVSDDDTGDGYIDAANDDYNLHSTNATMYSRAMTIGP